MIKSSADTKNDFVPALIDSGDCPGPIVLTKEIEKPRFNPFVKRGKPFHIDEQLALSTLLIQLRNLALQYGATYREGILNLKICMIKYRIGACVSCYCGMVRAMSLLEEEIVTYLMKSSPPGSIDNSMDLEVLSACELLARNALKLRPNATSDIPPTCRMDLIVQDYQKEILFQDPFSSPEALAIHMETLSEIMGVNFFVQKKHGEGEECPTPVNIHSSNAEFAFKNFEDHILGHNMLKAESAFIPPMVKIGGGDFDDDGLK